MCLLNNLILGPPDHFWQHYKMTRTNFGCTFSRFAGQRNKAIKENFSVPKKRMAKKTVLSIKRFAGLMLWV